MQLWVLWTPRFLRTPSRSACDSRLVINLERFNLLSLNNIWGKCFIFEDFGLELISCISEWCLSDKLVLSISGSWLTSSPPSPFPSGRFNAGDPIINNYRIETIWLWIPPIFSCIYFIYIKYSYLSSSHLHPCLLS